MEDPLRPHPYKPLALGLDFEHLAISVERPQKFNKQSAAINGCLSFGGGGTESEDEPASFAQCVPFPEMDFSRLFVPQVGKKSGKVSTKALVRRLLFPPCPRAFRNGVLSINWVISVTGAEHFTFRADDERFVLTEASELRHQGREMGLPAVLYEFLCGDIPESSAAEDGMMLTPGFFESETERE
ncbi:hypothetical protein EJ04DRAFT_424969 [Polyplosphaeria fusca]|uniref:Uncharacterized protein n=1 Tax=Polyplosphaeria fusca TaxID=682080 RepID=A0A9P4R7F8_9PLEO|nr:hypothetical protein EJ04DRAFT_424969 [Polyplosphaeria fusca]